MTRDEFKTKIAAMIDEVVSEDRELSESDEDNLNDLLGEPASEVLAADADEEEAESGPPNS